MERPSVLQSHLTDIHIDIYRHSHVNKSQISEGVLSSVESFVKLGVDKNLLDYVYSAKKQNKKTTAWSSFK